MKLALITKWNLAGAVLGVIGLTVVLILVGTTTSAAYARAQNRCQLVHQRYPFMITKFELGHCSFRENNGWQSFTPRV